jgi:hypothetical protein
LPRWARKTPKVTEVLPLLYLHGLSSGDFVPALGQFLGSPSGLSGPVITKLTQAWQAEQRAFAVRDLSGIDYVYMWADGIHVNIRLEEHKLPKSAHPGAKKALAEIWGAEDKEHARAAVRTFGATYGAKFPKAAAQPAQRLWNGLIGELRHRVSDPAMNRAP